MMPNTEILQVEEILWLVVNPTGLPIYDFSFRDWLHTRSAIYRPEGIDAVARIGAVVDYAKFYDECKIDGVVLINSPEEHERASQLERWYPLISELTPKSICFKGRPEVEQVKAHFGWPIFMKGARQTSRHQRKLSLIESDQDFLTAIKSYAEDPILSWQDVVCREFVPLRRLGDGASDDPKRMPRSFEFRTFWWKGELVGAGRYWWEGVAYGWTASEQTAGLAIAAEAARRVGVPFLVVDIAQTQDRRWIVIECNDGQESGYAGVSPFALWQRIVELERVKCAASSK